MLQIAKLITLILFLSTPLSYASDTLTVPGINGFIFQEKDSDYNLSINTSFKLHEMNLLPQGITLSYSASQKIFKIYGNAKIVLENDTISVSMGDSLNPGIEIETGKIKQINAGITGEFKLRSLSIIPNQLTFVYSKADTSYAIFGSLRIDLEKDTIEASLGQIDNPGLVIKNGLIQNINFEVTANFNMKSLSIKPVGLSFIYNRSLHNYKIFGAVELDIQKDTIKASLGTLENPGISISEGKVDSIFISVSSHFELKKLSIETDSLGIKWTKVPDGNVFLFFGKVKIEIDSNKIAFDFGTISKPGLVFRNGKIDSLKISTTDDIHFAGFEVATEDLTLEYSDSIYHLYGKIMLKKMWSAKIDLGSGPGSGITLDLTNKPAKMIIDKAEFELDDIDLGPVTLKDLKLNMVQNKVQEADLKVDIPPGWEIDAKMQFKYNNNSLEINSVDISWEALKFEEAIAIPGTGAFITKLEGGLYGIEDPHEFKVTGDIGIAFGGPFNIPKVGEVSLLYLNANTSITRSEFIIEADAKMGAYRESDGSWTSVLGDGHLKLDLLWGHSYSIEGNLNIPSKPWTILKADLEAQLSQSGALNAHMGIALQIPEKIPIVGGRSFAQAEGVIHYDKKDPTSYAAGWAKINLGFFTWKGGVKYNFQSKDYTTLGASEIKDVSNITVAPPPGQQGPRYVHDYININVTNSPNYVKVKIKFIKKLQGLFIEVDYPLSLGKTNLAPLYIVSGTDKITQTGMDITTIPTFKMQALYNLDSLTFYIMAPGYQQDQKSTLPNAEYTVYLESFSGVSAIKSFEVHEIFTPPSASWTYQYVNSSSVSSENLSNILLAPNLNYHIASDVYNIDSAVVNLFYTKNVNENGTILKTVKYADYWGSYPPDGEYLKIENINFPDDFSNGDSLYLYLTIDDKINAVYKSPVQYCKYYSPFQAKLNISGMPDSLASGIETQLFIQNPSDNKWYAVDSLRRFTNKKGEVSFNYSVSKNTKAKFVFDIPVGYVVDPSSPYKNGEETEVGSYTVDNFKQVSLLLKRKNNNGVLYVR
ncbi:hypothetical protein APF79_11635 [bacterium BRH_c32]|nr:MAG: hypothetical protein APF79_11635 [bacterium BRH_c32]